MAEFVPSANKLSFDANSFQGSNQATGKMHGFKSLSFKVDVDGKTKSLNMKSYMSEGSETIKTVSYVVLSSDESVKPDQATENTGILDYQLLDNEFLVKVERFGKPSNQIGDPKQVFVETGRSWDIYTNNEDPVLVEVTFAQGKEPKVQGLTFYSDDYENAYGIGDDGVRRGLTSITWKGGVFKCEPVSLETKMLDLTNFPMLSMRYKHDGNVYELDTNKLVKTYGNQSIDGKKVFKNVPQVQGTPVAADDVVNKAYVEENFIGTSSFDTGKSSVTGLIKGSNKAGSYCAFSYLKWLLKDGTRLDVKLVENVPSTSATTPVLAVWHVVKDLGSQINAPEQKTKQEIQDYELQEGEFKGTLSYFKAVGRYNCYQTPVPWGGYVGSGLTGEHEPMLGFTIDNLVSPLKALQLTVGDKGDSWSYNLDTLQVTGKNGTKDYDVTYPKKAVNNEVVTVEIPFSSIPDFVTVGGEQTISGVKTFAAVPKITTEPTDDTDAVNKKYVEEHFVSRPPKYDFKIDITCEGNSSYVAYSELKINLTGGKVIEPLYLEKREARPDNNIYRFVYKISDASAVTVKQTPRKTSSEMDAYQLQEGEYIGHLYYAGHFNSACSMNAYDNQTDPWYGYLFNGGSGKLTMSQIILSGLPTDVTGIEFKSGDKHNGFIYKSAKYGAKFTYGAKSQEHELTNAQATHEFLVDSSALAPEVGNSGFVELIGDQSINGVKTFLTPPKSVKAPTDAKDIANKAYVDNRLGAGFDVTFTIKQSFSATWGGLSKLHVELAKGVLEAKYVEDVMPANAKEPALIVWTTKSTATKAPQVTYKSKEDIKGYELQDGEYLGDITYAELLGPYKSHTSADYRCPFDTYLYNGGVLGQKPLIKVNIYSLKQAVKSVRYLNGYDGHSYVGADHAVDFVVNNVESTSTLTGAGTSDDAPFVFTPTVKTLFDNEKSNYVPIKGDAIIFDKKTFTKKVFITDTDQASEMVTGQVATMESLKAVGLIGKALPDTQYICLWGDLREVKKRSAKDNKNATYEMSELELHTATGQLYLKYMEEISAAVPNASKPQPSEVGLCVLSRKKEWDNTTDLPVKNKAFLKSYALQPGEFLAKVRVINGAWRSGLSSGAQTGVAPYGSNGNFAGLFAARAKNNDYAKFSCYMQGVINAETVVNQTFRYAEIIIYNAPAIEKIKLTSARDSYYSIDAADGGINTINAFISTDEKFNSFDKITSYIGGVVTEAADNSTKMYFDEGSKTAGYTTSPKSVEVPLTNYEEGTSQTESADAAYGYLQAVTISNDQDIAGNKTFIKPITCTEPPVENGHLVNKKYVDDELAKLVARIAALEAAKP